MPQLLNQEKEQIDLPKVPGHPELDDAWIVMDVSPIRANDSESLDSGMTEGRYSLSMLANRIIDWNFTGPDGKKEPITIQSVGRLHIDHYTSLMEKIRNVSGELSVEEKKDSSLTSQPDIQTVEVKTD